MEVKEVDCHGDDYAIDYCEGELLIHTFVDSQAEEIKNEIERLCEDSKLEDKARKTLKEIVKIYQNIFWCEDHITTGAENHSYKIAAYEEASKAIRKLLNVKEISLL